MFTVDAVASGLRYGVEIRDRHMMPFTKHARCFTGTDAMEWLTAHTHKAFLQRETQAAAAAGGGAGGANAAKSAEDRAGRLRILARSAALLLGTRLLETQVFRLVHAGKGRGNPFEDPTALFRFREDEPAGPVLNLQHIYSRRARPAPVVAEDLVTRAILLHLQGPNCPEATSEETLQFVKVAEELQMVDMSALPPRATTAFFLNVHNALMLHTHFQRRTASLESLKALRSRLPKLHQYQIKGKFYSMQSMSEWLLKCKPEGTTADPRLHFALSTGSLSCPDVRRYTTEGLDAELAEAIATFCQRFVQVTVDNRGQKTVTLPKLFKWHQADFGASKAQVLRYVSKVPGCEHVADGPPAPGANVVTMVKVVFSRQDWRKRQYGRPP